MHCGASLPGASMSSEPSTGLAILYPGGKSKKDIPFILPPTRSTIGRADENTITIDDEEISRHHVAIFRNDEGKMVVEDLNSTNGTFLNGKRINTIVPIARGDELWIGKTVILIETSARFSAMSNSIPQPDEADASTGKEDIPTEHPFPSSGLMPIHNASYRPTAREGYSLKSLDDDEYYIQNRQDGSRIRKLNKRSAHMWKLMDGQHSLYDILVDYTNRFQSRGSDRLVDLVDELYEKGLFKDSPALSPVLDSEDEDEEQEVVPASTPGRHLIRGFDEWLSGFYTRFGWWLQTKIGKAYLVSITGLGFIGFFVILYHADFPLFTEHNSIILGLLVLLLAHILMIVIHNLGQAVAMKAYHRRVRQAGFKFILGVPTFFVDSSDIWQEPKEARVRTLLAGPIACFFVGSVVSLVMLACPNDVINSILFKFAAWANIIAYFSLNPMFETAGYFALMDMLDIPQLRKRASLFIKHTLWNKMGKEAYTKVEIVYALYIVLCILWFLLAARIAYAYIQILFMI